MKEQFRENVISILEDKNVEGIPLRNINTLKYIFNDDELFEKMYKHFEHNFLNEFDDDDLYMKCEDYVYRLNMLVNKCIIPIYNLQESEDIKNMVNQLLDNSIDLYSAVSYDKTDKVILDKFCEICNERKIGI